MGDSNEDVCPICHEHTLYEECSCGEWVVGCENCGIETEPQDSEIEALREWDNMMKNRVKILLK